MRAINSLQGSKVEVLALLEYQGLELTISYS
jgi:hypothetical protein